MLSGTAVRVPDTLVTLPMIYHERTWTLLPMVALEFELVGLEFDEPERFPDGLMTVQLTFFPHM